MELRHLRYFVTVAEELHFGRAARRLHIQQPPLSFQIKQLEKEWKVKLFHRSANRTSLTPVGEALVAHARDLIASAELLQHQARRAGEGQVGRVAIGYVGYALHDAVPRLARAVAAAMPDLRVTWYQLSTPQQLTWLAHGRLDAGLLVLPLHRNPHLHIEVIQRHSLMAAVSPSHPAASQASIALTDLCHAPLLLPRRNSSHTRQLLNACQGAGLAAKHVHEVDETDCALALVTAGLGAALVPALPGMPVPPGVVLRPLSGVDTTLEVALAWWIGETSPARKRFLETARSPFV